MSDFTPYITAAIMLLGIIVGAIISPRVQHRLGREFGRKDMLFKKKLEYFEKIIDAVEKNKRAYYHAVYRIEEAKNNREVGKVIEELKQNRKHFLIMASPLYFNTERFSAIIMNFVKTEKKIFSLIEGVHEKTKEERKLLIERLKEELRLLNIKGKNVLMEMKKELAR